MGKIESRREQRGRVERNRRLEWKWEEVPHPAPLGQTAGRLRDWTIWPPSSLPLSSSTIFAFFRSRHPPHLLSSRSIMVSKTTRLPAIHQLTHSARPHAVVHVSQQGRVGQWWRRGGRDAHPLRVVLGPQPLHHYDEAVLRQGVQGKSAYMQASQRYHGADSVLTLARRRFAIVRSPSFDGSQDKAHASRRRRSALLALPSRTSVRRASLICSTASLSRCETAPLASRARSPSPISTSSTSSTTRSPCWPTQRRHLAPRSPLPSVQRHQQDTTC